MLLTFSTSPVDVILSRLYVEMKSQVSIACLESVDAVVIVVILLRIQPIAKTPLRMHFSLFDLASL